MVVDEERACHACSPPLLNISHRAVGQASRCECSQRASRKHGSGQRPCVRQTKAEARSKADFRGGAGSGGRISGL